jgi:hypothetical protein
MLKVDIPAFWWDIPTSQDFHSLCAYEYLSSQTQTV